MKPIQSNKINGIALIDNKKKNPKRLFIYFETSIWNQIKNMKIFVYYPYTKNITNPYYKEE